MEKNTLKQLCKLTGDKLKLFFVEDGYGITLLECEGIRDVTKIKTGIISVCGYGETIESALFDFIGKIKGKTLVYGIYNQRTIEVPELFQKD